MRRFLHVGDVHWKWFQEERFFDMKKFLVFILSVGVLNGLAWWFFGMPKRLQTAEPVPVSETPVIPAKGNETIPTASPNAAIPLAALPSAESVMTKAGEIRQTVPFTVQAPRGEWGVAMFQDACEEASVLMAFAWTDGKTKITVDEAERQIRAMTAWEDKRFGVSVDLSPEDTAILMREYFQWPKVSVAPDVTKQDIIDALSGGAVVIVPTDGKALKNQFFTAGGPDRHMLVIIGYDPKKKQFITNDPGTRHGEGYRYNEDVLYAAIRAYQTGDHLPIAGDQKTVIVVRKTPASS